MKGIGYMRVSTEEQAGEGRFGLEEQKRLITEYASQNGIQIVAWYTDKMSGVKDNRPAMDTILYEDFPGIDCVLVAKSDRVARDLKLFYYYLYQMGRKGMRLISVTEPVVDDGTGLGAIYQALLLFVAEQERINIQRRTTGGRLRKAAKGGYAGGKPPYGYKVTDGELDIVPYEAKVVKKIYELKDRGYTACNIRNAFNEHGIVSRSGRGWSDSTIKGVLKNESFYRGIYSYAGVVTEGHHPPLILEDGTWAI